MYRGDISGGQEGAEYSGFSCKQRFYYKIFSKGEMMKFTDSEAVPRKNEPIWSVWRKDDHGSTFLVKSGLTEADALKLVKEYQSKGHKQTYWAEKAGSTG